MTVTPWTVCGDTFNYAGKSYPTVQISNQCWFAENLDIGTMVFEIDGQGTSCSSIQKYCYDDIEINCTTSGGLYTWTQAMCEGQTTEMAQGICPVGWHIPSDPEYVTLTNYLGSASCTTYRAGNENYCGAPAGDRMKSAGLCQDRTPCGDSGFNGLMAGQLYVDIYTFEQSYRGLDTYNLLWTSSKAIIGPEAWHSKLAIDRGGVSSTYYFSHIASGRSIRCIED